MKPSDGAPVEPRLSIIMPVYNEIGTLEEIIRRVRAVDLTVNADGATDLNGGPTRLEKEIIIVDDGSTDGTRDILARLQRDEPEDLRIIYHERNGGKGAALRTGFEAATGAIYVVQDADLEYNPGDYVRLLAPILAGRTDVVYGSRFLGGPRAAMSLSHTLGNKGVTWFTNFLYGTVLTDMETCYKCFRRDVIEGMTLHSQRFEIEAELTAKILKRKYPIVETPISYNGRQFHEGKKLTWRDGFTAIAALIKYRFSD
ncbi:MAG: glycosyltransferase family 2 protein [Caldilineaceae bacterium SB0664_bin_27]|uniref:Glycosyltransferase family 2 protein n=1 Tax=Caldilineaceae bacterium SB0664_bin_27 TaxID=2605260 RepID=A0A6B0YRT7_9CHLR|nr:glycosyltransferase family 2 protein [Caldilineaceae bacterium SB0664_bin_27]